MVVALRLVSCSADESLLSFSIYPELYLELLYYNHLYNLVFYAQILYKIKTLFMLLFGFQILEKYKKGDRKLI